MKSITRFISLAALFLVPIFPLIVANSFFFPFITGKAFYFRLLVEIAFAAWFPGSPRRQVSPEIDSANDRRHRLRSGRSCRRSRRRQSAPQPVVELRAHGRLDHRYPSVGLLHGGDLLFGSGEAGKRMWHRWLNAIFVASGRLYGLWQLFGWAAIHQGSSRIDASLGNAAYMAVYMLWNAGLAVSLFTAKARRSLMHSTGHSLSGLILLAVFFAFELYETHSRHHPRLGRRRVAGAPRLRHSRQSKRSQEVSRHIRRHRDRDHCIVIALVGSQHPLIKNNDILGRLTNISLTAESVARLYIWNMAVTGWEHARSSAGDRRISTTSSTPITIRTCGIRSNGSTAPTASIWTGSRLPAWSACWRIFRSMSYSCTPSGSRALLGEKSVLTGLIGAYAVHNIFVFDNLASYVPFFHARLRRLSFAEGTHRASEADPILGGANEANVGIRRICRRADGSALVSSATSSIAPSKPIPGS